MSRYLATIVVVSWSERDVMWPRRARIERSFNKIIVAVWPYVCRGDRIDVIGRPRTPQVPATHSVFS